MPDVGYIKLHRKIIEWEWYGEANTMRVFLHLLLLSNYTARKWQGIDLLPGQLVTSIYSLAKELNLSRQEIRTALFHLESTQSITQSATHKHTLVTLANWASYQISDAQATQSATQSATQCQPTDQPSDQPQINPVSNPVSNPVTMPENLDMAAVFGIDMNPSNPVSNPVSNHKITQSSTHCPTTAKEDKEIYKENSISASTVSTLIDAYTEDKELRAALKGWVEMRQKKKKPLTPRAMSMALKKLDKIGGDKQAVVDRATLRCWEEFYAIDNGESRERTKFVN